MELSIQWLKSNDAKPTGVVNVEIAVEYFVVVKVDIAVEQRAVTVIGLAVIVRLEVCVAVTDIVDVRETVTALYVGHEFGLVAEIATGASGTGVDTALTEQLYTPVTMEQFVDG
jgi:hypothetical protein